MKHLLLSGLCCLVFTARLSAQAAAKPAKKPIAAFSLTGKTVLPYVTAQGTDLRLSAGVPLLFQQYGQPPETEACVFVDPAETFQSFIGIGGALTDASAETFAKLSKEQQAQLVEAYYSPDKGIGYTLARTNIHSCDFSSTSYTYVEDGDKRLQTFNIDHDRKYRLPLIKQAMKAAGGKLTMFVSPWSPPAWMKDNNDMLHGGKLLPEYRQAWANYYVKFIQAYEKEGIPVWGLSVQNEPMAKQTWESCMYTAEEERDFVKNFLGPTLVKSGLAQKKLIVWDHNRDLLYQRASTVLQDPQAAKYVWGVGLHWYEGGTYENVKRVHEAFPKANLLFTEACNYPFSMKTLDEWQWGENYGTAMINDFNNGVTGWTDWNILLDETGGPNHVQNFCLAPVIADTRSGKVIYTNAYYYLGHFSKFIRPGAKRVISSSNRNQLQTTAFLNKNGSLVVIVMNSTDQTLPYRLWIKGQAASTTSLPHSIMTLVL